VLPPVLGSMNLLWLQVNLLHPPTLPPPIINDNAGFHQSR
jgi:hypothetical protein